MKRLAITVVCLLGALVAALLFFKQSNALAPAEKPARKAPTPQMTAQQKEYLAGIEKEFGDLEKESPPRNACTAFNRFQLYDRLYKRYEWKKFKSEFGGILAVRLNEVGKETNRIGYTTMLQHGSFDCSPKTTRETYYVEQYKWLMEEYGAAYTIPHFDRNVVYDAYLRAAKKSVQELVADYNQDPNKYETRVALVSVVHTATRIWHCTLSELEVPERVIKDLNLDT